MRQKKELQREDLTEAPWDLSVICTSYPDQDLLVPRRMMNAIAEIGPFKVRDHCSANVGFNVAEGRFCFVFEALEERRDDPVLEIVARESCYDLMAQLFGDGIKVFAHNVITNPMVEQGDFRFFVLGNADGSMQSDGIPDQADGFLRHTVAVQEVAGGVRTVNFKALVRAAVMLGEPEIMEQGADV